MPSFSTFEVQVEVEMNRFSPVHCIAQWLQRADSNVLAHSIIVNCVVSSMCKSTKCYLTYPHLMLIQTPIHPSTSTTHPLGHRRLGGRRLQQGESESTTKEGHQETFDPIVSAAWTTCDGNIIWIWVNFWKT